MKNEKNKKELLDYGLDEWFVDAFQNTIDIVLQEDFFHNSKEESPEFRKKCNEAAEKAFFINSLRERIKHIAYLPMKFSSFIGQLAEDASISMQAISIAMAIDTFGFTKDPETINRIGHFAKKIGITMDNFLMSLRMELAESKGNTFPDYSQLQFSGEPNISELIGNANKQLTDMEENYSNEEISFLNQIKEEVYTIYNKLE